MTDETTPAEKREVLRASYDTVTGLLTIRSNKGQSQDFNVRALPTHVQELMAQRGVFSHLAKADDMTSAFEALRAGNLPKRKVREPKGAKVRDLRPWRKAYADVLIGQHGFAPMIAVEQAARISAKELIGIKRNPHVILAHAALTGADTSLIPATPVAEAA